MTGGETADVGDLVRTIVVDSTVTARIPRAHVVDNANIQAGDIIVGMSSSGKAGVGPPSHSIAILIVVSCHHPLTLVQGRKPRPRRYCFA